MSFIEGVRWNHFWLHWFLVCIVIWYAVVNYFKASLNYTMLRSGGQQYEIICDVIDGGSSARQWRHTS